MQFPSVAVKSIDIETGEEKVYTNITHAAAELTSKDNIKPIKHAIKTGCIYKGCLWEEVERSKPVFEQWMIELIKERYSGPESLQGIADVIGRTRAQVKRKVEYLGLHLKQNETDPNIIDYKNLRAKVINNKQKIKKGVKVRVMYYGDSIEAECKKEKRYIDAVVDGAYPNFFNVLINGKRVSYRYDESVQFI